MEIFDNVYAGRRVLVTGHTGFKGTWLTSWLQSLQAEVFGVGLAPDAHPSHWSILNQQLDSTFLDIRDFNQLDGLIKSIKPNIIFHMAAQAMVRNSIYDPMTTWTTNILGTTNILEIARNNKTVKSVIVITSDKVYEDSNLIWGHREIDRLGGDNPYSASKACAEIVFSCYSKMLSTSNDDLWLGSARAGNVIGGGDWGEDRLIPDIVRAVFEDKPLVVRYPSAIRPWQHVLDCLGAYLLLGKYLIQRKPPAIGAWNFGPIKNDTVTVQDIVDITKKKWTGLSWVGESRSKMPETPILRLDIAKAKEILGWEPVWNLDTSLKKTIDWYHTWYTQQKNLTEKQIDEFVNAAKSVKSPWIT